MLTYTYFDSPVGALKISGKKEGITSINFVDSIPAEEMDRPITPILDQCLTQLEEYFAKKRTFFDVPLLFQGTDFQINVWNELLKIPYAHTKSYLAIALALGDRKAVRAIGGACNQNPIAIIAPCHRVIGQNGNLTGYASGLDNKRDLLMLENPMVFGKQGTLF